jgi:hypothetical protein
MRIADRPSPDDLLAERFKDDAGQPYWVIRVEGSDELPVRSNRLPRDEVIRLLKDQGRREHRRALMQNAVSEWEVVFEP